jgi:hypothetical protein
MTWDWGEQIDQDGFKNIYSFEIENPEVQYRVYRFDHNKKIIEFYPKKIGEFPIDKIIIEGFSTLPEEFAEAGYIRGGTQYYLKKKINEANVISLFISKNKKDTIRKVRNKPKYRMVLSYSSFKQLKNSLTNISTESKQDKSSFVDEHFNRIFPKHFKKNVFSAKRRAGRLVNYLDEGTIEFLGPKDVDRILDFIKILLETKYKSVAHRRKLLGAAKVKVDEVALKDVIRTFENMLESNLSESRWGDFLKRNLFLVESKYIKIIPELNVVMASARKVDFGLVDSQGYLDLFEIKKPTTTLLAKRKDRGNYYWSTEAIKALVQAEKYLYNAERKATSLAEDINRERGIDVKVVRPRAVVVLGKSEELDNNGKQEDFRILRMSLKNIEIVLYDELLERLNNQRSKIYLDIYSD